MARDHGVKFVEERNHFMLMKGGQRIYLRKRDELPRFIQDVRELVPDVTVTDTDSQP